MSSRRGKTGGSVVHAYMMAPVENHRFNTILPFLSLFV